MRKSHKPVIIRLAVALSVALACFFMFGGSRADSATRAVNPDDYPQLSDKEMGQLRWILSIADQDLDDFTRMEAVDQYGMTAYRYSIAFMSYFLAVEQYHKLPAYPELIQRRMDRLIGKMIRKPVWDYWAEVSRGVPLFEPKFNRPYPEEHDPVGRKNIMYSGHLGHIIALYEMLYRDLKWSKPGSIVFAWDDKEKYVYDNHSLQKVMYEQMTKNPWHAIECEPNLCFPECNQHPVLSFMLYDRLYGTSLSEAGKLFFDFFKARKMIHPDSHETAGFYMVKQRRVLRIAGLGSSSANGWTGAFMHAWQPEYIERHYPAQRRDHVKKARNGMARLDRDFFAPQLQYGFFAMLAAEVGDSATRDRLLKYADHKYGPVWENGAFHYPMNLKKKCASLTGKLLAIARALPKNGLWDMHNRPFDEQYFKQPVITDVDFPKVFVRRAVYDKKNKALIVTTEPGTQRGGSTAFKITNLDPRKNYILTVDGNNPTVSRGWDILTAVKLDGRHDIVLMEHY